MGKLKSTTWKRVLMGLAGIGVAIALSPQLPAEAGIFDFLFGRRDSRGQPTGREQGGAVRSGRLVGGINPNIPYILTPRNTFHIDDHFWIEWNPVAEAETYTVRLWRWDDAFGEREWLVWEATTDQTAIIYNAEVPLHPARFYSVEVITDTGISSNLDPGCTSAGFSLLFPENLERLRQQLSAVEFSATDTAFLELAHIYLSNGMLDYAIHTLEVATNDSNDPLLHLALAELYSFAGLNQLSLTYYQQALELSQDQANLNLQAMALEGIGFVQSTLLKVDEAIASLQQAEQLYRGADADLPAHLLQRRIANLQRFKASNQPSLDSFSGCPTPNSL